LFQNQSGLDRNLRGGLTKSLFRSAWQDKGSAVALSRQARAIIGLDRFAVNMLGQYRGWDEPGAIRNR